MSSCEAFAEVRAPGSRARSWRIARVAGSLAVVLLSSTGVRGAAAAEFDASVAPERSSC